MACIISWFTPILYPGPRCKGTLAAPSTTLLKDTRFVKSVSHVTAFRQGQIRSRSSARLPAPRTQASTEDDAAPGGITSRRQTPPGSGSQQASTEDHAAPEDIPISRPTVPRVTDPQSTATQERGRPQRPSQEPSDGGRMPHQPDDTSVPLVLFDLNGTLIHKYKPKRKPSKYAVRPGVPYALHTLQKHFRLGVYTNRDGASLALALQTLDSAVVAQYGKPPSWEIVLDRGACAHPRRYRRQQPIRPTFLNEDGEEPQAFMFKPLEAHFGKEELCRILLVDDSHFKVLDAEKSNLVLVPTWDPNNFLDGILGALTTSLMDMLEHADSGNLDVRDHSAELTAAIKNPRQRPPLRWLVKKYPELAVAQAEKIRTIGMRSKGPIGTQFHELAHDPMQAWLEKRQDEAQRTLCGDPHTDWLNVQYAMQLMHGCRERWGGQHQTQVVSRLLTPGKEEHAQQALEEGSSADGVWRCSVLFPDGCALEYEGPGQAWTERRLLVAASARLQRMRTETSDKDGEALHDGPNAHLTSNVLRTHRVWLHNCCMQLWGLDARSSYEASFVDVCDESGAMRTLWYCIVRLPDGRRFGADVGPTGSRKQAEQLAAAVAVWHLVHVE
ncbi:hypothetical protein CYMTET_50727 [Cymbomonas tetramitiformis]|uniref:FCP1 homology domain-containing protein n=1 Tax=Cymbomonas tetramitiformis TaxID=36881 RepID=A0AAE0ETE7_9CHLO|nr:hypothetical protein CYMTET_50727 [Cymbomonas tetramitiformis]